MAINRCIDVYFEEEFYNSRVRATIPAVWVAEYENGQKVPICGEYEASTKEEAIQYLCERLEG